MPSVEQSILSASANYDADNWDSGATGDLVFRAVAQPKRGINLELGIGALAQVDAAFHKFLSADLEARAEASARLKGQIQVPMDLFSEAGLAVRLQAVAEAGVSVRLGIGLSTGDFLELAESDPRIRGASAKLLHIFLEELEIQGGVLAKAAISAMAYVNVSVIGRLIEDPNPASHLPAGFTIAGEFGLGLKGGAGWQVFARMGLRDPRALIRRSVDVLVDEVVTEIAAHVGDEHARTLLDGLRAPAKMALRSGFELGLSLVEETSTFSDAAPELARRSVMVMLEEMQRYLLEKLVKLAADRFEQALVDLGVSPTRWNDAQTERDRLASTLRSVPDDPFSPTTENASYWLDVLSDSIDVALALGGQDNPDAAWVEPVAITWAATQLLFAGAQKIANGDARASFLTAYSASVRTPAFSGSLTGPEPPAVILNHVRLRLGLSANTTLTHDHLVEYLVREPVLTQLQAAAPEVGPILDIVAGPQGISAVAAAKVIFRNLGAFVSNTSDSSRVDPIETLRVVTQGLDAYVTARIDGELIPVLDEALAGRPDLRIYANEVLVATMKFTVRTVFNEVVDWTAGDASARDAMRQACSSIVMKLLGRSLVVTADVLMTKAMNEVSDEFDRLADRVNDPGGVVDGLAAQAPALDREIIGELAEETLHIAAEIFDPLPAATRSRIRELLYDVIDTMPNDPDAGWVENLKQDFFIPNERAVMELAGELSGALITKLERFLMAIVMRIAELIMAELEALVRRAGEAVAEWMIRLASMVDELFDGLIALAREIAETVAEADAYLNDALRQVEELLERLGSGDASDGVRSALADHLYGLAKGVLTSLPGYDWLDRDTRRAVKQTLRSTVNEIVRNDLLDPVFDSLDDIARSSADLVQEVRELVDDLSEIDPNANLTHQISDLVLDRVEEAVRAAFDGSSPKFRIRITVGPLSFDLGRLSFPLGDLVALVRQALSGVGAIEDAARDVADAIRNHLLLLLEIEALEVERDAVEAEHAEAERQLEESRRPLTDADVIVLEPAPGALYETDLIVEIALVGVPTSFLGLGELEQERLFVWLNEELIASERFVAETCADDDTGRRLVPSLSAEGIRTTRSEHVRFRSTNTVTHWGRVADFTPSAQSHGDNKNDAVKRIPLSQRSPDARRLTRLADGRVAAGAPRPTSPEPTARPSEEATVELAGSARDCCELRLGYEAARRKKLEPGTVRRVGNGAVTRPDRFLGARSKRQTASRDRAGSSSTAVGWPVAVGSSSLSFDAIGTRLRPAERDAIVNETHPNIIVRLKIDLWELNEGINSLHVALTDGHDLRIEQTVVFLAAAAPEGGSVADAPERLPDITTVGIRPASAAHEQDKDKGPRPIGAVSWAFAATGFSTGSEDSGDATVRVEAENADEPPAKKKPRNNKSALWLPPRSERAKTIQRAEAETTKRIAAITSALDTTRKAIRERKLKPVPMAYDAAGRFKPVLRPPRRQPARPERPGPASQFPRGPKHEANQTRSPSSSKIAQTPQSPDQRGPSGPKREA